MQVSLKYTNFVQASIEHYRVLLKLHAKKDIPRYLLQYLIGGFFLVTGILTENGPTDKKDDCDCYHFITSLGIAWLFMTTISLIASYRILSKARLQREGRLRRYLGTSNEMEYIITDETVSFITPASKSEAKWSAFESYTLYKNYLLLTFDTSIQASWVIDMDLVGNDRSAALLDLVKQKLSSGKRSK